MYDYQRDQPCDSILKQYEYMAIWNSCEVWTHVIAFLEGNSKTGLQQAADQVPSIITIHQLWPLWHNGGWDRPRKVQVQFLELQKPCDIDLDLGSGQSHTGAN